MLPEFYPQTNRGTDSNVYWYREDSFRRTNDICLQFEQEFSKNISRNVMGSDLLHKLVNSAKTLSAVFGDDFVKTRGAINPFECLGKGPRYYPFINRSAMKMVNLDSLFRIVGERVSSQQFSFVDVCGGPGGFCEHLLSRCSDLGISSVGFAMSLRINEADSAASCNWKLDHLHDPPFVGIHDLTSDAVDRASHPQSRAQLYITWGEDETGDILHINNIDALASLVNRTMHASAVTEPRLRVNSPLTAILTPCPTSCHEDMDTIGVDFVCGDGGTGEGRDKEDQELALLSLLAAQVVAMLGTLRTGGCFLLKMFSIHTAGTVGLIFILSQVFEAFTLIKPVTSRPTSSERYLFCSHLRVLSITDRKQLQSTIWRHIVCVVEENKRKSSSMDDTYYRRKLVDHDGLESAFRESKKAARGIMEIELPEDEGFDKKRNLSDISRTDCKDSENKDVIDTDGMKQLYEYIQETVDYQALMQIHHFLRAFRDLYQQSSNLRFPRHHLLLLQEMRNSLAQYSSNNQPSSTSSSCSYSKEEEIHIHINKKKKEKREKLSVIGMTEDVLASLSDKAVGGDENGKMSEDGQTSLADIEDMIAMTYELLLPYQQSRDLTPVETAIPTATGATLISAVESASSEEVTSLQNEKETQKEAEARNCGNSSSIESGSTAVLDGKEECTNQHSFFYPVVVEHCEDDDATSYFFPGINNDQRVRAIDYYRMWGLS